MIQPIEEKTARYQVMNLMMEGKFRDAENLVTRYVSSGIIQRTHADFYYQILDTIRRGQAAQARTAPKAPIRQPSLPIANSNSQSIDARRLKFVADLGAQAA